MKERRGAGAKEQPASGVSIDDLLREEKLGLSVLTGAAGLGRAVSNPHPQKPGLILAGHLEHLNPRKLQVLGRTEITWLEGLGRKDLLDIAADLLDRGVVGFVATKSLAPPAPFLEMADARGVPVLQTTETTLTFIKRLTVFLEKRLAPGTTVHGVLMSIQGVGVLILGRSGIGKSECALDLVSQGHRLVADDLICLQRIGETVLLGHGPELARHHMEIRGLGIINIKDLFGVVSVLDTTRVDLVVELIAWDVSADHDRLGLDEERTVLLDVEVPLITIPVSPGRNLAVILEVAARNWLLKKSGYHAPRELEQSLRQAIARGGPGGKGEGA